MHNVFITVNIGSTSRIEKIINVANIESVEPYFVGTSIDKPAGTHITTRSGARIICQESVTKVMHQINSNQNAMMTQYANLLREEL